MRISKAFSAIALLVSAAMAQPFGGPQPNTFPSPNPIIKSIYAEAMDSSKLEFLAHELLDVIGPRLTGSPAQLKAHDWAVKTLEQWGVTARNEQWGAWRGWERGITHIDLLEPRVRTLEGTMLAWSPGTKKGGVTANTVIMIDPVDSLDFRKWLPTVKGKFVLVSPLPLTGRPDDNWEKFAVKESFDRLKEERKKINDNWMARVRKTGFRSDTLANLLEQAGAAGVITNRWSMGWGVDKIFGTNARKAPVVNLSVEDYSLVYRLTESGKNPLVRIEAEAKFLGERPAFNTIGEIKGTEKPDEYVILSAHLDSWDAGSGATDNGSGSILMMEVMRILKKYYPSPKRTILVGLWGSEEQGLNGSAAFVADHPAIVPKIQASFNQDNGTGRVTSMSGAGLLSAGEFLGRWLSQVPTGVTQHIKLSLPGSPAGGGSDNASFTAAGAPGFSLGALDWDYFIYTWHTNRDTYDKLVFDDIKNNAVLAACLTYLASEDPEFMPRVKRELGPDRQGNPGLWPPPRSSERAGGLDKK